MKSFLDFLDPGSEVKEKIENYVNLLDQKFLMTRIFEEKRLFSVFRKYIDYILSELQNDPKSIQEFIIHSFMKNKQIKNNKEISKIFIEKSPDSYDLISPILKAERDVSLLAVTKNSNNYKRIPDDFKKDLAFIKASISDPFNGFSNFRFFPFEFRDSLFENEEFVKFFHTACSVLLGFKDPNDTDDPDFYSKFTLHTNYLSIDELYSEIPSSFFSKGQSMHETMVMFILNEPEVLENVPTEIQLNVKFINYLLYKAEEVYEKQLEKYSYFIKQYAHVLGLNFGEYVEYFSIISNKKDGRDLILRLFRLHKKFQDDHGIDLNMHRILRNPENSINNDKEFLKILVQYSSKVIMPKFSSIKYEDDPEFCAELLRINPDVDEELTRIAVHNAQAYLNSKK